MIKKIESTAVFVLLILVFTSYAEAFGTAKVYALSIVNLKLKQNEKVISYKIFMDDLTAVHSMPKVPKGWKLDFDCDVNPPVYYTAVAEISAGDSEAAKQTAKNRNDNVAKYAADQARIQKWQQPHQLIQCEGNACSGTASAYSYRFQNSDAATGIMFDQDEYHAAMHLDEQTPGKGYKKVKHAKLTYTNPSTGEEKTLYVKIIDRGPYYKDEKAKKYHRESERVIDISQRAFTELTGNNKKAGLAKNIKVEVY